MNWEECKFKRLVKEVKYDAELIKSLIKQSGKKLITDKFSPLNEDTISTKFCNNYDSLREILEAVALQKGFKIYNHECFTGFLKEILKLEKESFDFDRFRILRNSINYYGKDISVERGDKLIKEILLLRNKLIKLLEKNE
jgi:hypothetical protein